MPDLRLLIAGTLLAAAALLPARGVALDRQDFTAVERGRYLADAGDCGACHTLPGSGQLLAGGRPIETPFGILVAPNITPDPETGIGARTDDEFVNSLRQGTGRNGEHLYPAMPYTYMTKMTREDALAIRAYLETLPAVRNTVRVNQLAFPFDLRSAMVAWDRLYFKPGEFRPVAEKSAAWNRGAYLVEGAAHCGLCHTPKNLAGGDDSSQSLQGYALQGWFAPNITNDERVGLGGWSIDDIAAYLATGHNRLTAAGGLMSEVVMRSTSKLKAEDLRAIATYLKDVPGASAARNDNLTADAGTMKIGMAIYSDECSACHGADGSGVANLFPALKGSAAVQSVDPTSLLHLVLRGARSAATDPAPTAPAMPSFGWLLNDEQVGAVLNYVRNAWGNRAAPIAVPTVTKTRQALVQRND
jgi:mono/diheme cytochrome c family protein